MKTIMIKLYWKFFNACMITAIILCVAGASGYTVSAMMGPTDNFAQNSMDSFDMMSMYDVGDYSMDQFYNNADDLYTVDALNDMNEFLFFGVDADIYVSDTISNGEASIYLPEYETAEPAVTEDGMWSSGMNDFFGMSDIADFTLTDTEPVDINMLPEEVDADIVFIEPVEMASLPSETIVFDPEIQDNFFMETMINANNLLMEEDDDDELDVMIIENSSSSSSFDYPELNNEEILKHEEQVYTNIETPENNIYMENALLTEDMTNMDMMFLTTDASDYDLMENIMMEQTSLAAQNALEQAYQQAMQESLKQQEQQDPQNFYEENSNENGYSEPQQKTSEDYDAEFEYFLSLIDE